MQKIAIVTGSSRGIGREIAKNLARKGIKVIANYNNSEEAAKSLKEEMQKENIQIDIFKADVSDRKQGELLVNYTLDKYKKIDILINNAGISEKKLYTDESDEDWNRVINNNLYSAFMMSQEVIPNMIHRKEGCIINISSIFGIVGGSMEVLYSVSKAGMDGLTKALAKELGPSNIRVNSIAPGIICTDMNKKYNLDEFIKVLMEEKTKYINDNFKNLFESIKKPNIDEIVQLYKDQEPIEDYEKVLIFIKDFVKTIQENRLKKNYSYDEFILLLNNSINKLYDGLTYTNYNNSYRTQNSNLRRKTEIKNNKNIPFKRSNTFLKESKK